MQENENVCRYVLDRRNQQKIYPIFCARFVWNSRKDAIARQNVFTLVIFGLHRTCMHIRAKLPQSTYRAVSNAANLLTMKLLLNSIVSTPGAIFLGLDLKDFHLNRPMDCPEYLKMKLAKFPDDGIAH